MSLTDDSAPEEDKDTKQSPSLSKLIFGGAKGSAPTFNSPDRAYNRGVSNNGGAASPTGLAPSNGSVTSPSKTPGKLKLLSVYVGDSI